MTRHMTRYKRRAVRDATMRALIAEVRALRAEVAVLSAERIQIVPYPYPQPYPVYPVVVPQTIPWARPWEPSSMPRITFRGSSDDIDSGLIFTPQPTSNIAIYNAGGTA